MTRDKPRLLITGTGRCGTKFMMRALKFAGVPCRHETAFSLVRHGEGDWIAESSWVAAPYLSRLARQTYVVHLVRHPLQVIRSRAAWGSFVKSAPPIRTERGNFAMQHCPAIKLGRNPIERAAIMWVEWNAMVHARANERIRIEDVGPPAIVRLANEIGFEVEAVVLPPRDTNSAREALGPLVTWDEVEHVPGLIALARSYGYA